MGTPAGDIAVLRSLATCVHFYSFVYTGQWYNPQTHFTNRGVPVGFVTQHGYAGYPLVPMPLQQEIVTQPNTTVTAPFNLSFGGRNSLCASHPWNGCCYLCCIYNM